MVHTGTVLRLASHAALVGVLSFIALYAVSALLYPGGTYADPMRVGFSIVDNYWCDLLDATTHGGRPNPGRPVALVATIALCAGVAVLWWTTPVLFPHAPIRAALVRGAGLGFALITPFVATPHHDSAIHLAALLGLVGFVAIMTAFRQRPGKALDVVAIGALGLALVTYGIWITGVGISTLPLIQKGAFALFLAWIVLLAIRLRHLRFP